MKKQSAELFTQIGIEQIEGLGTIDTLATSHNLINKHLTAADLWNIQRHGKRRIQRRMVF